MANGTLPPAIAKGSGTASLKAVLLAPAFAAAPAALDDRPGLHLGGHRRHRRLYRHAGCRHMFCQCRGHVPLDQPHRAGPAVIGKRAQPMTKSPRGRARARRVHEPPVLPVRPGGKVSGTLPRQSNDVGSKPTGLKEPR